MSTEERVAFLNAYTDYAAARFGVPKLDALAVSPAETERRVAQVKPQPLTSVRNTIRLNDGWKQAAMAAEGRGGLLGPWRQLPGVELKEGELILPAGTHEIVDLAKSSGWRYELRWEARRSRPGAAVRWFFGNAAAPKEASLDEDGWQAFRLQVDLTEQLAYLSRNGKRLAQFPLAHPPGKPVPFRIQSTGPVGIRDLVFVDYRDRRGAVGDATDVVLPGGVGNSNKSDRQPYEPVVLADDDFRSTPAMKDWQMPGYDDRLWQPATLPCVHGGFREAREALYLRRSVELPAARRVVLEIEALDPSGDIYVNGQLAARIPNRLPVCLDITPFVEPGTNTIACKVNFNWIDDLVAHALLDHSCGWFAGRMTLHLLNQDAAIREMLVNTTSLDASSGAGQTHRLELENPGALLFDGSLEIAYRSWFPHEGAVAGTTRLAVKIPARGVLRKTVNLKLPGAVPWTPEAPFLYQVTATLRDSGGKAVDDFVLTTGVRTVAQKDGQLLLNGRPALLIGAQNMGMRPYPFPESASKYNRCATPEMLMSEILAIKNAGGNLFRIHVHLAFNSTGGINDPRIAEMADQVGMALFWCSPAWIREGDERSIDTANVGQYIRQVYHHPSIINWEMGNHPNEFKREDSTARTDEFVRRTVNAVLAADSSRLITPTTFWGHTHYANDLGTLDWKQRPIQAVPEYTHPLVTRGSQDAVTGYGAQWTGLRRWPSGRAKDCLDNKTRAWFNFEHEESTAQPNWNLSGGYPWHRMRSYEIEYDKGSIGRTLKLDEWRASQGWQAFSAYESMRKQIFHGVAGFSWCTIEGGANGGTYEKPLLDPFGHAKLAWYVRQMLCQPVFAGSDNADVVYGPGDEVAPVLLNIGPARAAELTVTIKTPQGATVDSKTFPGLALREGFTTLKLPAFKPKLPADARYCVIDYSVKFRPVDQASGKQKNGRPVDQPPRDGDQTGDFGLERLGPFRDAPRERLVREERPRRNEKFL